MTEKTTVPAITEADGWLTDAKNNRASIAYFGSRDAAKKALMSLQDCDNCNNCSGCSGCSDCSDCSRCSRCSGCSGCSGCSDCSGCSGCSRCAYLYGKQSMAPAPSDANAGLGAPAVPVIPEIHKAIYAAVNQPCALDMGSWHTCETTHCRAGWVVALAGQEGQKLEKFHNTELAAMLIYKASGFQINPARFHDTNEAAMEDMRRLAEGDVA